MDISDAWGYAAVIVPKELFWQGFKVMDPETPELKPSIAKAIESVQLARASVGKPVIPTETYTGDLAAALAEVVRRRDEFGGAVFSSALAKVSEHRFFVVEATIEQSGTTTRVVPLDVSTPEQARAEIDRRVMPLKFGQALNAMMAAKKP